MKCLKVKKCVINNYQSIYIRINFGGGFKGEHNFFKVTKKENAKRFSIYCAL